MAASLREADMSKSILEEANELINGDRAAAYGSPLDQYVHLAGMFNAYLGIDTITWQDAINLMILIKVNRVRPGKPFHRDSYADTAGYAGCAEKAHNESEAKPNGAIVFRTEPLEWEPNPNDFRQALGQPRQWGSVWDIPVSVEFIDPDGDRWMWKACPSLGSGYSLYCPDFDYWDIPQDIALGESEFDSVWDEPVGDLEGPFTEILGPPPTEGSQ